MLVNSHVNTRSFVESTSHLPLTQCVNVDEHGSKVKRKRKTSWPPLFSVLVNPFSHTAPLAFDIQRTPSKATKTTTRIATEIVPACCIIYGMAIRWHDPLHVPLLIILLFPLPFLSSSPLTIAWSLTFSIPTWVGWKAIYITCQSN